MLRLGLPSLSTWRDYRLERAIHTKDNMLKLGLPSLSKGIIVVGLCNWNNKHKLYMWCIFIPKRDIHSHVFQTCNIHEGYIFLIITPSTSFSQSRHSIDVTWWRHLSPRYTQRQKWLTGIHWKCLLSQNKGCRCDKFVIRYITDVLRTQSRFVKCVGGLACGLPPPPPHIILQTYFGPEVRQKQTL